MPLEIVVKHQVYVSDTLATLAGGEWVHQPHLYCLTLTRGVSPTIDQATLLWHFGTMRRESDVAVDAGLAYVAPLEIAGKYIRIEADDYDLRWFGYVLTEEMSRGPEESDGLEDVRIAYGTQQFGVVGLEWFLGRETIHESIVYHPSDGTQTLQRAIGFNTGMGDGRSLTYEARANRDSASTIFASDPTTAEEWTAEEEVLYLLENHGPRNIDGDPSPAAFWLPDASEPFLSWYKPTVQMEGHSVWQVLNDIIDRRRSLIWWLEVVDLGAEMEIWVRVTSMEPSDVSLPDSATLPEALSQITLTLNDPEERPLVRKNLSRKYDRVICRGARRRAVFTVSIAAGNLEPSWRSTDETAYRTALGTDAVANDHYREANRFERVYQCFQIPPDWDGTSNDGSGTPGGTAYACPTVPAGSLSIIGAEPMAMPGLRLLPIMPIKVGYDYADAAVPTARDPDDIYPEYQRPFAFIDIDSGDWRFTHDLGNLSETGGGNLTSYHLRVLNGTPGLQVTPGGKLPHVIASGHFDPNTDGASNVTPELAYDDLRCTVCGEWDSYCEGMYPANDPTNAPVQTLYISIGDRARLDWLAQDTVYDIENGTLKTVADGGPLRDDRNLCLQIAQIAYQWYGQERAELTFETLKSSLDVEIGDLITTVGTGAALQTVNATVTQLTYDFHSGRVSVNAGFAELDFAGLA